MDIRGTKGSTLKNKTIVIGLTGSIAVVKTFELARELIRLGANIHFVVSKAALELIGEKSLEYACGNKVVTDLSGSVEHIKWFGDKGEADVFLIAPCTANTISKIAMGIDDTPITTCATVAIGSKKPIILVPAMHKSMYDHPIVEENLEKLKDRIRVIEPLIEEGKAKIPSNEDIILEVERVVSENFLKGKKVLITSGRTELDVDPIRVLTSKSSGLTGRELAKQAYRLGASVTIVHNGTIESQIKNIGIRTKQEMFDAVLKELESDYDLFVSAAAISDFDVDFNESKIKSDSEYSLNLRPGSKLIKLARDQYPELFIVGFKAEAGVSEEILLNSAKKSLEENNLNLVVANDVKNSGIGQIENGIYLVSEFSITKKIDGEKSYLATKIFEEILKNL